MKNLFFILYPQALAMSLTDNILSLLSIPNFIPKILTFRYLSVTFVTCCFSTAIMFRPVHSLVRQSAVNRHSRHRYFVASRHILCHINPADLGIVLPTLPSCIHRPSVTVLCMQEIRLFVSTQHDGHHSKYQIFSCDFQKENPPISHLSAYRETCRTFDIVCTCI